MEEPSFVTRQSASHAGPCTCAMTSVVKRREVPPNCGCCDKMRLKQGEEEVAASKWRALVEQKAFRGTLWTACGMYQSLRRMWERFTIKKSVGQIGPDRCRQCEAKMERTAGGNTRRRTGGGGGASVFAALC